MTHDNGQQSESLLGKIARIGISHAASGGVASSFGAALDGPASATDVTGLHGAQLTDGTMLYHGPDEGGPLLDRPVSGYLAQSSVDEGISIERSGDLSSIARSVDDAGVMTVDGQRISVLDYIPGGDVAQLAAGHVDRSQLMVMLAQHGISQGMQRNMDGGSEIGGPLRAADLDGRGVTVRAGDYAPDDAAVPAAGRFPAIFERAPVGGERDDRHDGGDAGDGHVPDADENARDLEQLAMVHRMDLGTAVETSDQSAVHSEMHAHGRTLSIDTAFEARAPDTDAERREADEHVRETVQAPQGEHEHRAADMHFRSRVQAHLDVQSRDEGISL